MPDKTKRAKNWKPSTLGVHGLGRVPKAHFAVSTPLLPPSHYYFEYTSAGVAVMKGEKEGGTIREHEYGRYGNPTQQ
jgi:O-acetylhomoserine/O-acetylserine sulfhydrylase-like pyridoxal-dependent enzyme